MKLAWSWLGFDGIEPRGRWDSGFLLELLAGNVWLPPGGVGFEEIGQDDEPGRGRVIIFPAGPYPEHGSEQRIAKVLSKYLAGLEWSVLIATSDECALFPWKLVTLPESCRLWIQCPQPEKPYPIGARFIPFGPQTPPQRRPPVPALDGGKRYFDVYFHGQVNHERREEMWAALEGLDASTHETHVEIFDTGGFAQGKPRDEYLADLWNSWITPAPSGPCTQGSFRLYEALDAGCIPLACWLRPPDVGKGYWSMVMPGLEPMTIAKWDKYATDVIERLLERRHFHAAVASSRWQQFKRRTAYQLHRDTRELAPGSIDFAIAINDADDLITVIIPTSPVPSNPDLSMIQTTVAAIRQHLPHAEILIGCDGVRAEQEHRRGDYEIFCHELAMWCNTEHNVCPWVFDGHVHQSGMLKRLLAEVNTPYVLWCEHDTPLEGEIDFPEILGAMNAFGLNSMRFYHDVAITEGSEHLFLHRVDNAYAPFVETLQYSARPHVARTGWYEHLVSEYLQESVTMLEDALHGVMQHGLKTDKSGLFTDPKQVVAQWERWRMAVYAPGGSIKRSGHLDGRGDDPKYPIAIRYSGERPEGGMPEGEHAI